MAVRQAHFSIRQRPSLRFDHPGEEQQAGQGDETDPEEGADRRIGAVGGDDADQEGPCFLEDLTRAETIEAVRKAILSLPAKYREVVVLCELQDVSYEETAEILGCAIGTVRSRLHRARALLFAKLRPADVEDADSATAKSARCFA